jgi:hypothetical protein
MTARALITQMLDCIEELRYSNTTHAADTICNSTINAAHTYLAAPVQSLPVAVVELVTQALRAMPDGTWWQQEPQLEIRAIRPVVNGQRLYTAAPQPTELTDSELSAIWDEHIIPVFGKNGINPIVFARAVLAAQKAKV